MSTFKMSSNGRCDSWRRLFKIGFWVTAATVFFSFRHLDADVPERSMANLQIQDQGSQLIMSWHFFYFLLPKQFILHEKQDEPIALQVADDHLLEQDLSDIVQVAFEVKIDGQTVRPTLLKLTRYANKSCLVLLSYPGHVHSHVELRAPVLHYFPPGFVLIVSVTNSTGKKGAFFGRNFPPVVHFVQGDILRAPAKPFFSRDFIAEWGTAWVNYNWILTCVVLLLMRQPKQMAVLIGGIVVWWIFLSMAAVLFDFKVPYRIPEMVLCVPTVLLCILCGKDQGRFVLLTLVTGAAGLLNAGYDIQQIPLSEPAQTVNALIGLSMGFVGGMALVLLVVVPLWWECRKYPGFQESWAPKIAWAVAGVAVFLPIQKWLFG
jgi:hypothetical protein